MRKILSLLGILALSSTTIAPVVACKPKDSDNPSSTDIPVNDQVKKWAQESSIVAKSLLTSKQQNINTNSLLNDTLKNNTNNIKHDTSDTTDGNSYQSFANDWGYNHTITGNVEENNFIDNSTATDADNFNKVKDTISQVENYLPIIKSITPETLVFMLNAGKETIKPILLQLNNSSIDIPTLLSTIGDFLDSLKGFDPKNDLTVNGKNYYEENNGNIAETILGPNLDGVDGWFTASGYDKKSQAESEDVNTNLFTKENISKITSWDSFFMVKTSIDINDLYKTTSSQFFGEALNDALVYNDQKQLVDIDATKLLTTILPFMGNPAKLISLLTPVIKWQILGFAPTTTIKTITDGSTPSDVNKGILNIKDVMTTVKNLIASPENFANFFINLLSANDKNQGIFSDVVINTTKDNNPTTFTQAIEDSKPFHDAINDKLKNAFKMLAPYLKQYNINNSLETIIKTFTSDDNLNIDFIDFSDKIKKLFENQDLIKALKLINNSTKNTIEDNWNEIISLLGVNQEGSFAPDSPLGMILALLQNYEPTISTILTNVASTIDDYINDYIYKPAEKVIDFNNDTKLWSINVNSCTYDAQNQQSTITYTLTQGQDTYNIIAVIAGNAGQQIGTNKSQIWIKDITLKS